MKFLKWSLICVLMTGMAKTGLAQERSSALPAVEPGQKPKLVVGIVVDQMRYDYLPRYWSKFGDEGFKRLIGQGYNFRNNHYNYFPTYTGPGHAAVYTGATPSVNGIVGNSWYDRSTDQDMYVVSDSTVKPVGTDRESGKMSPANLISSTVTDELKKMNEESKVVAVSIKDRGAVLPAGHIGDGAYWYEGHSGNFITSSWYRDELPDWVQQFNEEGLARELSKKSWETLIPIDQYRESNKDNTPYEGRFRNEERPVFPHDLDENRGESYSVVSSTPFGNTLVKEFAKRALDAGQLGSDGITDFLSVSFSSTDYVGHKFGPNSIELQDTYMRLDRDIADLLNYLDRKVGEGKYLLMLTSDHGAVDVPAELMDRKLPGGYFNSDAVLDLLDQYLVEQYGKAEWIEAYANQQIYLDRDLIRRRELSLREMQNDIAAFLLQFEAVASTNTASNFQYNDYVNDYQAMYQRGFLYDRSGDVYIQLKPGWLDTNSRKGTSHGSPYAYDTHVPLIFFGWGVPHGETSEKTFIPQIAPTISGMLDIEFPNGSSAQVLRFD
ncbi:Type I phosphodiesterase / nucleotide pyrophosphatase [Fodinibius sediminis]|uniref:Type I phosphodiesterase / nucleotide pyrophosphatase n=2 Tax=Fodinibius sediminis TaxID=1214077 RepID=A0A521C742_9BACT|nr:Type I phosphodiesterase / nucleotide pyrophosphatase [Fodinibius sediminis]